jgi:hypothetical protein
VARRWTPPSGRLIHPSLQSSLLWLGSHIWSCARELEETPPSGRHRAAGFLVRVLLLPLLRWTEAQTMSIHQTCVEPRRCCHLWCLDSSTCSTTRPRCRLQLSQSTMFVQNVFPLSSFKGMNTVATLLPYNYIE